MTATSLPRIRHDSRLGPDPEPLTGERFDRICDRVRCELGNRSVEPLSCPLEQALGRERACRGKGCLYYRVPGVPGTCAVATWTAGGGPSRQLATWFLARHRDSVARPSTSSDGNHRRISKEEKL